MIKRKIAYLLMLLMASMSIHAADGIKVHFDVKNPVASTVVLVYNMSINEFPLTDDGKATADIEGIDALYAKVYYGEKFKNIYLQSGDEMTVAFDASDFDNTFSVKGGNEKAVDYLNKIQLTGLPDDA